MGRDREYFVNLTHLLGSGCISLGKGLGYGSTTSSSRGLGKGLGKGLASRTTATTCTNTQALANSHKPDGGFMVLPSLQLYV